METTSPDKTAHLTLEQMIQRKIDFIFNDEKCPVEHDDMDAIDSGKYTALKNMQEDSITHDEQVFSVKYLNMIKSIKAGVFKTPFEDVDDREDYMESYNNTVVTILTLINPAYLYDLDEE